MALFALPIVASFVAYHFFRPDATANYGELLVPPAPDHHGAVPARRRRRRSASRELRGKWVLVASDSGRVPGRRARRSSRSMRQVRLMLGRNAARVERVFVADDTRPLAAPSAGALRGHGGASRRRPAWRCRSRPVNDRAHVYLVDPLGNVMMRFPAERGAAADAQGPRAAAQGLAGRLGIGPGTVPGRGAGTV